MDAPAVERRPVDTGYSPAKAEMPSAGQDSKAIVAGGAGDPPANELSFGATGRRERPSGDPGQLPTLQALLPTIKTPDQAAALSAAVAALRGDKAFNTLPDDVRKGIEDAEARMIQALPIGDMPESAQSKLTELLDTIRQNHGASVPTWNPIRTAMADTSARITHMRQVNAGVTPPVKEALEAIRQDLKDPRTGQERIVNALMARGPFGLDLKSGERVALYNALAQEPALWNGVADRLTFSRFTAWVQAMTTEPGVSDLTVMRTAVAIQRHRKGEPFQADSDRQMAALVARTDPATLMQTMNESLLSSKDAKEATGEVLGRMMARDDVPQAAKLTLAHAYVNKAQLPMVQATDKLLETAPLADIRRTFGDDKPLATILDSWVAKDTRVTMLRRFAETLADPKAPQDMKTWARKQFPAVWEPWVHYRFTADQYKQAITDLEAIRNKAGGSARTTLDGVIQRLKKEAKTPVQEG
jgi:hypothetical protein